MIIQWGYGGKDQSPMYMGRSLVMTWASGDGGDVASYLAHLLQGAGINISIRIGL